MGTWRDRMGPAKFRDVEFYVDTSERTGGRRGVVHEYPLRDLPYVDDLGRRARTFAVEAYVLGDGYMAARDRLIDALEQEGAGELVHPYHGTRRVIPTGDFRVRESKNDGGMAVFDIEFTETEAEPRFPTAAPAGADTVEGSAATARAAIGADLVARYAVAGVMAAPQAALDAATAKVEGALAVARLPLEAAAAMRVRLDRLAATSAALVTDPADLFAEYVALFTDIASLDALALIYPFDPGLRPPSTTATRLAEQAAFDLVIWTVRTLAAVRAAEVAAAASFDSYDAAVAARDAILERLDEQAESAGDDAFAALAQVRADLVRAVPGADVDLPRLVRYTPPATVPSLVLAHRLYGDLAREADLLARNRIQRPGFILGGVDLEVLSRG